QVESARGDLAECPRHVVHVDHRVRRPLRLRVEVTEFRRGPRVTRGEDRHLVSPGDESLGKLGNHQLRAPILLRRHCDERRGNKCDPHVMPPSTMPLSGPGTGVAGHGSYAFAAAVLSAHEGGAPAPGARRAATASNMRRSSGSDGWGYVRPEIRRL